MLLQQKEDGVACTKRASQGTERNKAEQTGQVARRSMAQSLDYVYGSRKCESVSHSVMSDSL